MTANVELSHRPNSFGDGERQKLKTDLSAVKEGRARLLVARCQLAETSQDTLDVVLSAVLLTNYLLMGSSSGRVVKLIDIVGAGERFNDIQSYATTNYLRALLTGGYAAFNHVETWCETLGLEGRNNISGMTRFADVENFLKTCSRQVLSSKDLEVAEASIALGHVFDTDERFKPFDLQQGSSLRSTVECDDISVPLYFDQVSDFDRVIIRTTKDRNIVQLDMNFTDVAAFKTSFTPASKHLYDLNFMRQYPAAEMQKPFIS